MYGTHAHKHPRTSLSHMNHMKFGGKMYVTSTACHIHGMSHPRHVTSTAHHIHGTSHLWHITSAMYYVSVWRENYTDNIHDVPPKTTKPNQTMLCMLGNMHNRNHVSQHIDKQLQWEVNVPHTLLLINATTQ